MDKKIDLSGFKMKKNLNPEVWVDGALKKDIRKNLLKIADDYYESLDLEGVDIIDVTLTGSLANYNWSKYSDIDLHIIIDYKEVGIDNEILSDYLRTKSRRWNETHDIVIYGFDVEIYVQDINEKHESNGVYSILNQEWLLKPTNKNVRINDKIVVDKSKKYMEKTYKLFLQLSDENVDYEDVFEKSTVLKEKIMDMRKEGLDSGGQYSTENIIFKVLRRNGTIEMLNDINTISYDKSLTI